MSDPPVASCGFETAIMSHLPRLRIYALSLTRDGTRADDLVQQTVMRALIGRHSFQEGTNLAAWLSRIERNEFISGLRRERPTVELSDAIEGRFSHPAQQESGIILRELKKALCSLAEDQRSALLLHALGGLSQKSIADATSVAVGTVKSRVSRARASLRQAMDDEDAPAPRERVIVRRTSAAARPMASAR